MGLIFAAEVDDFTYLGGEELLRLLNDRMLRGEVGGAALGCWPGRFLRWGRRGCSGNELELQHARVQCAHHGLQNAVGFGVEHDGKHCCGERGVELERITVQGEMRVFYLLGGGLLAFGVGQGGNKSLLDSCEIKTCI